MINKEASHFRAPAVIAAGAAAVESIAQELLGNANSRAALVVESEWRGLERLSFSAVRTRIASFFARI